jgi:hypothetical protein
VFLKLLADLGADNRYGDVERVHGLDLGRLLKISLVSFVLSDN